MGQSTEVNTVSRAFNRPELGMGLHKKTIVIQSNFVLLRQRILLRWNRRRCQDHQLRSYFHFTAHGGINKLYLQLISVALNIYALINLVAQEDNPLFPCLPVKIFT